ncbi:CvpA family protein [bacterium]|nr:MAG: CvpA family protein [bacterium]
MNWLDLLPIVLIVGYGVGGFFSGVVRRAIGLVVLYLAFLGATNMGLQAGGILQQSSNLETPDARIFGFFGIVVAVLVIVEGATQLAHSQIQIPALVLNRTLGVIIGVLTAVFLSVLAVYELEAAANPFGGAQLDQTQQRIRDTVNESRFAVTAVNKIDKPVISLFQPVLPGDPQIYFGPGPVNP